METKILLTGILGFLLILFCVCVLVAWLYAIGKKQVELERQQEAEYVKLFNDIQKEIDTFSVMIENRDLIRSQLNTLSELKWKDKEKESAIWNNFMRKFYSVDDLRDKLVKTENDRFDAVNSFEL